RTMLRDTSLENLRYGRFGRNGVRLLECRDLIIEWRGICGGRHTDQQEEQNSPRVAVSVGALKVIATFAAIDCYRFVICHWIFHCFARLLLPFLQSFKLQIAIESQQAFGRQLPARVSGPFAFGEVVSDAFI
ncbi:MAG: hypothetical protein ACI9HK_001197, partial [Pirellulaceae bacterium]